MRNISNSNMTDIEKKANPSAKVDLVPEEQVKFHSINMQKKLFKRDFVNEKIEQEYSSQYSNETFQRPAIIIESKEVNSFLTVKHLNMCDSSENCEREDKSPNSLELLENDNIRYINDLTRNTALSMVNLCLSPLLLECSIPITTFEQKTDCDKNPFKCVEQIKEDKIMRIIPSGYSGRILGKEGRHQKYFKNRYGAQLLIYNHTEDPTKMILEIKCPAKYTKEIETSIDKTLLEISNNNVDTVVSKPDFLKATKPLGKLLIVQIVRMTSVSDVQLVIADTNYSAAFCTMQQQMNEDYASLDSAARLPRPITAKCICVAKVTARLFTRAIVLEISAERVFVYLLDAGEVLVTCFTDLFKMREKYMNLPYRIQPAKIDHIQLKDPEYSVHKLYKKLLYDPIQKSPRYVLALFSRMMTCCVPWIHVYVPLSLVKTDAGSDEFIDFAELLVKSGLGKLENDPMTICCQQELNQPHFDKTANTEDVPAYFVPSNSCSFYHDSRNNEDNAKNNWITSMSH